MTIVAITKCCGSARDLATTLRNERVAAMADDRRARYRAGGSPETSVRCPTGFGLLQA